MIAVILTQVIDTLAGYKVVGHAKNSAQAMQFCEAQAPDLVILDLVLPGSTGLILLKKIKAKCPHAQVLIFSGNLNADIIRSALVLGVGGIIGKAATLDELKAAILAVSSGRAYLCAATSEVVRTIVRTPPGQMEKNPVLSRREQTVLRHIAAGLSSKEIAAKLGLSCYTVNNFRSRLSKKTGLHRAVQLSLYAARIGLVAEPDEPLQPAGR